MGYRVLETREPGGTPFAERTRELLLHPLPKKTRGETWTPTSEACLIFACRSQHLAFTVCPALQSGMIVLCDRYADSTLAYQGYGRGLSLEELKRFQQFISHGLIPDKTFLFDLPVKIGLARRRKAKDVNRLDLETLAFHDRVRKGFLKLAKEHPGRSITLKGQVSMDTLATQVLRNVEPLLTSIRPSSKKFQSRKVRTTHRRN